MEAQITRFLQDNKFGTLATTTEVGLDVRPMEAVSVEPDGVYFYVAKDTPLFRQVQNNPHVAFCATDNGHNYVKLKGKVSFQNDEASKEKILASSVFAKQVYPEGDTGRMAVMLLEHGTWAHHQHGAHPLVEGEF